MGRGALAIVGMASAALGGVGAQAASPAPTPPSNSSAIGANTVNWIATSAAFAHTGFALLQASGTSCKPCLWATHDGGASWAQVSASGWNGGRPVIAVDSAGREVVFSGNDDAVQRSDDGGRTWVRIGTGSMMPAPEPSFPSEGAVAVAGKGGDYVATATGAKSAGGSAGSLVDLSFMVAPTFPSAGSYAPALLSAADKQNGLPVIQQCTAQLACTGNATLPGAVTFSIPVTLLPSTGYAQDGTVFAQSGRGIYKSLDGGKTFAPLTMGQAGATGTATPMLALAPGYSEHGSTRTAFAAVFQIFQDAANPKNSHSAGGIYKSTDGGTTWNRVGSPSAFDRGASAVAMAPNGRLFAGYLSSYGSGLLCSVDGGVTWRASCPTINGGSNPAAAGSVNGSAVNGGSSCAPNCAGSPGGAAGGAGTVTEGRSTPGAGNVPSGQALAATSQNNPEANSASRGLLAAAAGGVAVLLTLVALLRRRVRRRTAAAAEDVTKWGE
jgi:photosystem II stability/assembly factor-like uncharacterized protein